MFLSLKRRRQRVWLHMAAFFLAFAVNTTVVHAQDAPQDAISRWMQEQLAARQRKFAQLEAMQSASANDFMGYASSLPPPPIPQASPQMIGNGVNVPQDAVSRGVETQTGVRQDQLAQYDAATSFTVSPDAPASNKALQDQIYILQRQLERIEATQAIGTRTEATTVIGGSNPPPPTASATPDGASSSLHDTIKAKTGVNVTLGGWFDGTAIYRSKNESADFTSNINTTIPFNNAANAHQSEFRETARATRLRMTVDGSPDVDTRLGAFIESDFAGAAPTATSTSTNSYTPRLYQGFFTYERNDWGMHALAGQAFSMLTMNKTGIDPMAVNTPLTIDPSYSAGFNFTRNPQLRVVEDFDNRKLWVGISAESPQAVVSGLPCTANASTGTCSGFNSTYSVTSAPNSSSFANNVTTDTAPDIIVKAAYDPGWGHYEVFGITRFFHDNVDASFHNNIAVAAGGGASMILPMVRKYVDFQTQFMLGDGIGRYGSAQLPDFAIMPNGALKPIYEQTAMAGVVAHPDPSWDTYGYVGEEKEFRVNSTNTAYGYGDFGTANVGCYTAGGSCSASTSSVWEIVTGFWKRLYDGNYGKVQIGMENSIVRRNAFGDSFGSAPHAYEDIAMTSFRYFPF